MDRRGGDRVLPHGAAVSDRSITHRHLGDWPVLPHRGNVFALVSKKSRAAIGCAARHVYSRGVSTTAKRVAISYSNFVLAHWRAASTAAIRD